MSALEPIRIPMEVTTGLSADQALEELLEATREPLGPSIMAHRQLAGTVSRDRVVLRRGTIPGWSLSRGYGEFQGRLVDEGGSVRLRGEFVEAVEKPSRWGIAAALLFLVLVALLQISGWRPPAPFDGPVLGLGLLLLGFVLLFSTHWWRLGIRQRRENVAATAELLRADIARILRDREP